MKMPLKKGDHKLIHFAAGLGIFQGLVWTILAILGICYRFKEPKITGATHSEILSSLLGQTIQEDNVSLTLNGLGLFSLVVVYLIISIIWIGLSVLLITSLRRRQQNNLDRAILIWGVITLLTCIYDVVVTGLLASNYTKLLQLYNDNINTDTLVYAVLAYGTLFSLAARGYVLWVVNLAVSILMIRNGSQRLKTKNTDVYGSGAIDAFEDERNYPQSGQVNQAYNWDNNTSQFNREITQSTSGFGKPGFGGENVQNRQIDHVARLGKQQGPRNYPQNISAPKPPHNYIYPSPHIPRPDYSPLPRLKSALKNYPPPPPKLTRNSNRY